MSTTARGVAGRPRTGRVDDIFHAARHRLGRWYFHALCAATAVPVVLLTSLLQGLAQVSFWTGGRFVPQYLLLFLAVTAATAPLVLGALLLPRHRALVAYLAGRQVDLVRVWRDCVTRLPASAVVVGMGWATVVSAAGLSVVGSREGFGVATYVESYVFLCTVSLGVAVLYLTVFERALLPVTREVAGRLPAGFDERSALTGRSRLIVLSSVITLTVGCETSGIAWGFGHDARIVAVPLITLALVSTYIAILINLSMTGVSHRVDDIAVALTTVAAGGEAVRIPPTTGDEVDRVGAAFNEMVDVLESEIAELQASRARLIRVADLTRRHIERDLHDGAQQSLALVNLQLGRLELAAAGRPEAERRVKAVRSAMVEVIGEMRALARGIYPASLETEGLQSALRAAAREAAVPVLLAADGERCSDPAVETAAYFCCWEAIRRARLADEVHRSVLLDLVTAASSVAVEIRVEPGLPTEQSEDLVLYLRDRMGAVGGTVLTYPQGRSVVYRGTVGF